MKDKKELKLINMKDVSVQTVDWLWYPFIPFGKITIVQGDPGEGKTTLLLRIISLLTTGGELPISNQVHKPTNVIYQTAEDGLGDTIKPRLIEAEADCSRVLVIDDEEHALHMTDERLEEALIETKARLIVLDPIQAYLGSDVDMHRANEIRPIMKMLGKLAEKYSCAIVLIGHMNKASGANASHRGLGSIDFQAATRSVLIVGRIKDDPEIRVVVQGKSSLAPEGKPVAFKLERETGFEWIGEYDISVDDLLRGESRGARSRDAKAFLKEVLKGGSKPQKEVMKLAQEQGIRDKTLRNAKDSLGVKSEKVGRNWHWLI